MRGPNEVRQGQQGPPPAPEEQEGEGEEHSEGGRGAGGASGLANMMLCTFDSATHLPHILTRRLGGGGWVEGWEDRESGVFVVGRVGPDWLSMVESKVIYRDRARIRDTGY